MRLGGKVSTGQPHLTLASVWHDDDIWELRIHVSDGQNSFTTQVYQAHADQHQWVAQLTTFSRQVCGGLLDLQLGHFGPEYAAGAVHLRFHFLAQQKIHLSIHGQSDFYAFGQKNVASEARLYFIVEPAQLDRFVAQLQSLKRTAGDEARLLGVTA